MEAADNHPQQDNTAPTAPKGEAVVQVDQGMFDRVYQRMTAEGVRPMDLPRREATFTVDHTVCMPGVFTEDFEVTIRSLSSADELAASRSSNGDPVIMAFALAKASLRAVNGRLLKTHEREVFWEWLDSGGRQVVTAVFTKVGMADEETTKKAMGTLRIS